MKTSMQMLFALAAAATLVAAGPITDTEEMRPNLPGPIVPVEWTGNWGPDGEEIKFEGTVEELMDHVAEINPAYDFNTTAADDPASSYDTAAVAGPDDWSVNCDIDYAARAQNAALFRGVQHLRKLKGNFKLKHNGCGRVACSSYAAIWDCWDNYPKEIQKPWSHAANGAEKIIDGCPKKYQKVKGEAYDGDDVRMVVGFDWC